MLALERRSLILLKLETDGKVIVADLAREFDITEETIRRDLEKLENEGLATKIYGGAVAKNGLSSDLPFNVRKSVNIEEKKKIAKIVSDMIKDGDRIMLDASSTAIYITNSIKHKKSLTVITNSVEILLELADKSDWSILSTGGTLKEGALSLNGTSAEKMIRSYHVDIAICSCKGVDFELGITDSNEKDCQIKQAIFASADKKILAVDSTKFDKKSFIKVCDLSEIDCIVTDTLPPEKWVNYCKNNEIEIKY